MPIPTWSVGQVLTASDVDNWFVPLVGFKSSDTSRASNTTQSSDPDLTLAVAANATYFVNMWLNYEGGTQGSSDLKMGFAVPSGATLRSSATFTGQSGAANTEGYYTSGGSALTPGTNGAGNIRGFILHGTLIVGSSSGSLTLSWAQNTSSGTATTIHTGSILILQRIG